MLFGISLDAMYLNKINLSYIDFEFVVIIPPSPVVIVFKGCNEKLKCQRVYMILF